MYQVIELYGDLEPWWFLEDWQDSLIKSKEFETYKEALDYYQQSWENLAERFPSFNSHSNLMAAFWEPKEQRWCEECGEFLQQYHSVALLSNWQELTDTQLFCPSYNKRNDSACPPSCQLRTRNENPSNTCSCR